MKEIEPYFDAEMHPTDWIRLNAGLNGAEVVALAEDVVGTPCRWDRVVAGDVCYEAPVARRILPWLRGLAAAGAEVWLADPGRAVPGWRWRPEDPALLEDISQVASEIPDSWVNGIDDRRWALAIWSLLSLEDEDELIGVLKYATDLFDADTITGADTLNLVFDDPSMWDVSQIGAGIITFGEGSGGQAILGLQSGSSQSVKPSLSLSKSAVSGTPSPSTSSESR